MKKLLLFLSFLGLVWAEIIKAPNEDNIIIYAYSPPEDANLSSLDPVQTLKTLPHQRAKFQKITQGVGTGQTREEALNNALIDVLSQLKGVSNINLRQEIKNADINFSSLGQISQSSKTILQNVSKGRIDSYKIDKAEQNGTTWQVELSAYKYLYQSDDKPKLVLFDNDKDDLGKNLNQALNDVFSQSQNFTLLERKNDFKNENELIQSEQSSSEEAYKLGNVLGADYILEFEILDASKATQSKISYQNNEKISLNIAYKLVFYPTREIVLSKSLNANLILSDDVKKEQKAWENIALGVKEDLENSLFSNLTQAQQDEKGKEATYKLHEKGGVDLGF